MFSIKMNKEILFNIFIYLHRYQFESLRLCCKAFNNAYKYITKNETFLVVQYNLCENNKYSY
jgi:hypothetical protein